jgi:hypothetical protein
MNTQKFQPLSREQQKSILGGQDIPECGVQAGGASCTGGECCSQYGYCGTTNDYCCISLGCQQGYGPCYFDCA